MISHYHGHLASHRLRAAVNMVNASSSLSPMSMSRNLSSLDVAAAGKGFIKTPEAGLRKAMGLVSYWAVSTGDELQGP